jgi:hypothetical protein
MTSRKNEGAEPLYDEERSKAIHDQIKIITEARGAIEAAMRNLPWSERDRETIVPLLSERYMDLAKFSAAPQAKSDIESQISEIREQATVLLMNLCGLNTLAVDAIHLAMKEGDYPPKERLLTETAAMVFDPRPKALGDIMGRLEVLSGQGKSPGQCEKP